MLDKCQRKPQLSLLGLFKFLTSSAHAFLSGLGDFFFLLCFSPKLCDSNCDAVSFHIVIFNACDSY